MYHLAADVDGVVIVGRDHNGKCPVPAILHVPGRPAVIGIGPDHHAARLAGAHVGTIELAVIAARPYDVRLLRIRNAETTLASAHRSPFTRGDAAVEQHTARAHQVVAR